MWISWTRIVLVLFLLIITGFSQELEYYNHPELEWSSFKTDHFVIHFHQGTQRTARIVAKIAEEIYLPITSLYQYQPTDEIHLVIKDTDDYSNGGAYFFDNKIEIWAENLDYIMRGTHNWLRNVVTHEFAHMISIQKMIKFSQSIPYGFLQIFGYEPERRKDVVRGFPNTLVSYPISSISIPVWFAEGVAQYQAPNARYDYRDPNREMVLRDRVIHNQLLTYGEMGVFGKNSHGNESAYNQGFAFVNYLCNRFGDQVLERITRYSSQITTLTFDQALKNATGVSADSLYQQWKLYLESEYRAKLSSISKNLVRGKAIELEGFANLYPVWSPDGSKVAYVSNKGNDYFGQNKLMLYDLKSGKKTTLTHTISSSISWSPDGRYIAFARHSSDVWSGSSFNDLYIYDFGEGKELRLSKQLRGKNPDWNHEGNQLVFVTENNGLNQLNVFNIENLDNTDWKSYYVNAENGSLSQNKPDKGYFREVKILDGTLKQLIAYMNGRQIYHPRWSRDDKHIIYDTAIDYGRNIAVYHIETDSTEFLISGKEELRYPVYHPYENAIYYASSETGIYNLYKMNLDTKEKLLLTNVTGAALMPDINTNNELVYAGYDSLGFHIYTIPNHAGINIENAFYEENYTATIPVKNFDDSNPPQPEIRPYKQNFTKVHILPRLLVDYGTVKPGFYLVANEVLDQMSLIAGADVNLKFDYDLYGILEYRKLYPTLFLEAYNLNQNITDTLGIRTGENVEVIDQDINFNLVEIQAGAQLEFPTSFNWRLAYIISFYNAKLDWFDPFYREPFTFRYRYLNGRALQITLNRDNRKRDRYEAINPGGGRRISFRYAYEDNNFLVDFDTGASIGIELYKKYAYHKFELDWEEHFTVPFFRNHTLTLRLNTGYIDRPVDDFFYLYGGGFVGMKGYSYYSFGGTKKLLTTLTYRLPIANHIDWSLFNIYFDKLYAGFFYDYGNAWNNDEWHIENFKRDIGLQIRLETFSNYLFPTRIFFETAYPLEEIKSKFVKYTKDWRFYFGILFDFDVRERMRQIFSYLKRP